MMRNTLPPLRSNFVMPLLKFERILDSTPNKCGAANDANVSDGRARFQSCPTLGGVTGLQFLEELFAGFQFGSCRFVGSVVQLLLRVPNKSRSDDWVKIHLMTSAEGIDCKKEDPIFERVAW